MIKRVISIALALMLMVACMAGITVSADEVAVPEEFDLFIAYGGDKEAEGDWGWGYTGTDVDGITAVTSKIKVGETATVSLTFDTANVNTWYMAPCLVAEDVTGITSMDVTVTCKIDGADVSIDAAADKDGKTWWTEDTGDYKADKCIRLYGGYNEWATQYIAEPASFTTVEYTVTLNSINAGSADAGEGEGEEAPAVAVPEEFDLFIAYGGDKEAEGDWGWGYTGTDVDGITAVTSKIKVGETATVSLTFDTANVNTWYMAPCLVAEDVTGITSMDVTVTCKIDGEEVTVDAAADKEGKIWWTEDTGDYKADKCIRVYGGYNEWATQYIPEPASFTTVEYTVTLNSINADVETGGDETVPETEAPTAGEFDPNGTYNAYLMLQTPNWTYRDDCHSDTTGIGTETWGNFIYGNETGETYGVVTDAVIAGNGTYTVSITDFGTIFADDFATAGQDYFNIIGISTDIPVNDTIQITDVKLIVDGSTKHTQDSYYQNPDKTDYVEVLIQNIWNEDVKEISYYPTPSTSLEIQFTVSGFSYDAEGGEETPDESTAPETTAPDAGSDSADGATDGGSNNMTYIIIAAVVVIAVVVVVVIVSKKKKA